MTTVSKENAEHYVWGDACSGWHLARSKALSVIQEQVPTAQWRPVHYHTKAEQFFFVLSGLATIEVDGEEYSLPSGNGIHVPAGTPHQLKNLESCTLEFIVISTPPSHGDRIEV